eukprot:s29_g66.t1
MGGVNIDGGLVAHVWHALIHWYAWHPFMVSSFCKACILKPLLAAWLNDRRQQHRASAELSEEKCDDFDSGSFAAMYSTPSTPGGAIAAGYAPGSPFSSVRSDRSRGGAVMPATAGAEQHMQLVRQELNESLDAALQKRRELIQTLDQLTHKQGQGGAVAVSEGVPVGLGSSYDQPMSRAAAENLDQIDWRVARMMYCLDPKYNAVLDPAIAFEIQQKKAEDGISAHQWSWEMFAWLVQTMAAGSRVC